MVLAGTNIPEGAYTYGYTVATRMILHLKMSSDVSNVSEVSLAGTNIPEGWEERGAYIYGYTAVTRMILHNKDEQQCHALFALGWGGGGKVTRQ